MDPPDFHWKSLAPAPTTLLAPVWPTGFLMAQGELLPDPPDLGLTASCSSVADTGCHDAPIAGASSVVVKSVLGDVQQLASQG